MHFMCNYYSQKIYFGLFFGHEMMITRAHMGSMEPGHLCERAFGAGQWDAVCLVKLVMKCICFTVFSNSL